MPTWNAAQYLKFAEERTRPCKDLANAINISDARRVIDLGCGPGNSTQVLAERWPDAEIVGLDNSSSMIEVARTEQPQRTWILGDISEWASTTKEQFDVVFSNAAMQWVDNHPVLYPKLLQRVRPGGVLATQIPADFNAIPHQLMRKLAPANVHVKEWHSHEPAFYYDVLSPHASTIDVFEMIYQQVMPNADAIVEWYKGTGMRPFLEALPTDIARQEFLEQYTLRIRDAFPKRPDGKVLFPFRRLFVVASR
jgi:trans-aconitate 2-methyltransferase